MKIIRLSRDFMFGSIFNKEKNIKKLEKFISVFFNVPFELVHDNLKLEQRKLPKNKEKEAYKEMDLQLTLKNAKLRINIELNSSISDGIINRNIIFLCKMSSLNYQKGDMSYSNIMSSKQINLNLNEVSDDFIEKCYFIKSNNKEILSDVLEINMINFGYMKYLDYDNLDEVTKMVYNLCSLLSTENSDEFRRIGELIMSKEETRDLLNQIEEMSQDSDYVELESDYSKAELERNTLIFEAQTKSYQKGMDEKAKQLAIEFSKNGVEKDIIAKSLGISLEKLNEYLDSEKS